MNWGDWPGRAPPVPDVPIERNTIGAMRVTSGSGTQPDNLHDGFRAYVYRGTGFDTLTPHLDEDWERGKGAPMPESKRAKKRRPKKRKARPKYKPKYWPYYGPEHVLERPEPDEADDTERIETEPEPDPFEFLETMETGDAPEAMYRKPRPPVRPAPGWEPSRGADLDAWMEEYGA